MVTVSKLVIEITDKIDITQSPDNYRKQITKLAKRMGAKNIGVRLEYDGKEFTQHTAHTLKPHIGKEVEVRIGKVFRTAILRDCSERNPVPYNDLTIVEVEETEKDKDGNEIIKKIQIPVLARDVTKIIEPCATN